MSIQLQACYGSADVDKATDIAETENGYIVIGEVPSDNGNISNYHGGYDLWVLRIDTVGFIEWERCYGGSEYEIEGRIISDNEGNYYLCCWTASNDGDVQSGNHGGYDVWVVKINGDGGIIWEKCFGGSGTDETTNLKLLSNGNLLITCNTTSPDGDLPASYGYYDAWVFTVSPDGDIVKNEVFGNDLHNGIRSAIEAQDGGYFFTSETSSTNGMVNGTYHGGMLDVWAVKLDSNMNIEWQSLYGGSETDYGSFGLIELSDGYLFLAQTDSNDGDVSGFHGGLKDIWAVRIDMVGIIIWQTCLGGSDYDVGGDLFQTEDGGFIIFGRTHSNNGDVSGNHSWPEYSDIWMVKLDSDGEIIWQQCYGGLNDEEVSLGIIKKSDFNWVIAGSFIYNTGDIDCTWQGLNDYWIFEIKDTTTGINEEISSGELIRVYPNPAKDYVVFEINDQSNFHNTDDPIVTIFNYFGQVIKKPKIFISGNKLILDTRSYKPGVYFFTINSGELQRSGKLIIQ